MAKEKADDQLVAELKAKHGKVITVIVPLDEDDETKVATFHLKKPDATARRIISKTVGGSMPQKAVIVGFRSLWIGGDDVSILETNEDARVSAEEALVEILQVQKAIIKKN